VGFKNDFVADCPSKLSVLYFKLWQSFSTWLY